MTGKLKTNILIFLIAGALIALIVGYLLYNKPHRDIKDADAIKTNAIDFIIFSLVIPQKQMQLI